MNKNTTLLFLLLACFAPYASAQKTERSTKKTFEVSAATTLEIDSKFGDVRILTSGTSNVEVMATFWVEGKNQKQSEELLKELGAEIIQQGATIIVKSIFPESIGNRNNLKYQVDFTIKAPESVNVNLRSRYGSVYLAEINGLVNLEVAYGSLQAVKLGRYNEKPLNQLKLSYSSGSIEEAGWIKTDLAYSKLLIDQAEAIVSMSKYSVLTIDDCSSIASQSKYDTYKVGVLNNYAGDHSYSNLKIQELNKKLEIRSSYSNVRIDKINEKFEKILIDNSRGNYKLLISKNSSFSLNGAAYRGDITVTGIDNLSKRQENADKFISGQHGIKTQNSVDIKSTEGTVSVILE
jgi:hypothetical protein